MKKTDKIKAELLRKKGAPKVGPDDLLSTGSTTLNLACSGDPNGGFAKGYYVFFVGDSNSGKTFLGLTCLAEATINPNFDGYRLIHDDVEGGALMDIRRFFGKRLVERLEPPAVDDDGNPVYSETAEQLYFHLQNAFDDGRPFIWVVDSQDCMSSEYEHSKFEEVKKAHEDGKKTTGSFGDAKAKVHSANIRRMLKPLERSGSILIILNQTRDSFSLFEQSSYSGGRALKFYATLQLWSSKRDTIAKTVKGKKRQLGIKCKVQVKKNRIVGKDRTVIVPIYHSVGIDDIGGCIDYLVEEGIWKKVKASIVATGMGPDVRGDREKLVAIIEEKELEEDLRELVADTWEKIEKACVVERRSRYE